MMNSNEKSGEMEPTTTIYVAAGCDAHVNE